MALYNGFDINTSTTPKPWGAREEAFYHDLTDTLVKGTIAGAKDATNGHRHKHNFLVSTVRSGTVTIDASIYDGLSWRPEPYSTDDLLIVLTNAQEGMEFFVNNFDYCSGKTIMVNSSSNPQATFPSACGVFCGHMVYENDGWRNLGGVYQ